jgi:tetratricopeptide (TPR) repeat protein
MQEAADVLRAGFEAAQHELDGRLSLDLAETLLSLDDPAAALGALRRHNEDASGDAARWNHLRGNILLAQGDAAGAVAAYERSLAVLKGGNPPAGLSLRLAMAARRAGRSDRAWQAIQDAMNQYSGDRRQGSVLRAELALEGAGDPADHLEAFYDAGLQSYFANDLPAARDWLERALAIEPAYKETRWLQVDILLRQAWQAAFPYWNVEALAAARRRWSEVLAVQPPTEQVAWPYITGALIADGESQLSRPKERVERAWEGIVYLERSLLLSERNWYAWVHLSRLYRAVGSYGNALLASERALEIKADDPEALSERMAVLADLGDVGGAEALLDRLEREPTAEGVEAFLLYMQEKLQPAIDLITRVIERQPDDPWNLAFRADCLRMLALERPKSQRDLCERARADYRRILGHRDEPEYAAHQPTLAWAAYGLGDLELVIHLLEPLLDEPADPSADSYRTLGCCHLRQGDLDRAAEFITRGIDGATSKSQLKSLEELLLAEIEHESAAWTNNASVRELIRELKARIAAAREHLARGPSAEADLRRVLDWGARGILSADWSRPGATAALARIALSAGRIEDAASLYATLRDDARFPGANDGLKRVAARYHDDGITELAKGWSNSDATAEAVRLFERSLAVEPATPRRAERLTALAVALIQLKQHDRAAEVLAEAAIAFGETPGAEPGTALANALSALVPDLPAFWSLDAFLRQCAEDQVPAALKSTLEQVLDSLAEYPDSVLDSRTPADRPPMTTVPIVIEVAVDLSPAEGKAQEWPLLRDLIPELRERIEDETGVRVPGVRIPGEPETG